MKLKKISIFAVFFLIILVSLPSCTKENTKPGGASENTVTINPDGGTFILENGLQLEVPPGALDATTDISIELLDHSDYSGIPVNPVSEESLLLAFEGKPDGTSFNKAITIQASGISLPAGKIPILKELGGQVQALPDATLEYDSDTEILKITLDHFSAKSSEAMDQYAATECAKEPCKCKKVIVKQWDGDNVCDNGSCQVMESTVSVTYPECSPDPEVSVFREVTDGCIPKISLEAENSRIAMGGSTGLTATVELGCVIIKNQSVDFVIESLGSISPTYVESDNEGKARTTFKAGNTKGVATIRANSTISYYTSYIEANGECFYGDLRTPDPSPTATVDVEILDSLEIWEGTFRSTLNFDCMYSRFTNYHIDADFRFTITPSDWELGYNQIPGTIEISQSGSITPIEDDYLYFKNFKSLEGRFDNYHFPLDKSTGEIMLFIDKDLDSAEDIISYDMWAIPSEGPNFLWDSIKHFRLLAEDDPLFLFRIPLNSETATVSGNCFLDLDLCPGTYTLTMTKSYPSQE